MIDKKVKQGYGSSTMRDKSVASPWGLTEDVSYVPLKSHNIWEKVTGIVSFLDLDGKYPQEVSWLLTSEGKCCLYDG